MAENTSIIQVDVDSSDFVVLKIISDATDKVWFERETRWDVTSYWTPPSLGYGIWRFVFHNPSSTPVNVTAKVTEFYTKVTEYQEVTYYRSLFDPIYGYGGIIALIAAIGLDVIHVFREAKKQKPIYRCAQGYSTVAFISSDLRFSATSERLEST